MQMLQRQNEGCVQASYSTPNVMVEMKDREDTDRGDITITWISENEVELRVSNYASIDRGRIRRFRVMPAGYVYELDFKEKWQPVRDEGLKPCAGGLMLPCKEPVNLAKVIEREYDKIRSHYGVWG